MIPNRFHFVFGLKKQTEPFHLAHYLCLESCWQVNQPDALYFYYHYQPYGPYWDLIKEKIIPIKVYPVSFVTKYQYKDRYIKRYRYAHESDFIRLEKLIEHGGIYADIDTIFVNKIPAPLFNQPFVLGREDDIFDQSRQQYRPSLCNAFIMAQRDAPFAHKWLAQSEAAFDGSWSNHSTLLPYQLSQQYPDLLHIEPSRTFYKHMWTQEGLYTLLRGCDPDLEGVVSIHLWSHLWWSRWRRDFSTFHASLLTEDYIRRVDTTYNLVARKFLPSQSKKWPVPRVVTRARNAIANVKAGVQNVAKDLHVLGRTAAFSLLGDRLIENSEKHLRYARLEWSVRSYRARFKARNNFEQRTIINNIILWDEYELAAENFAPDDVILDIGAHVGAFSYLCYLRGSRNIYCYEPELENYKRLNQFLAGLEDIHKFNLAVFRSDAPATYSLTHSGYYADNTGAGNVLMAGHLFDGTPPGVSNGHGGSRQCNNVLGLVDFFA
jgi:hypothetical protein